MSSFTDNQPNFAYSKVKYYPKIDCKEGVNNM